MRFDRHTMFDKYGYPTPELGKYEKFMDERMAALRALAPEAHVTYYPMEGKWMAFSGVTAITWDMFDEKIDAIEASIKILQTPVTP